MEQFVNLILLFFAYARIFRFAGNGFRSCCFHFSVGNLPDVWKLFLMSQEEFLNIEVI